MGVNPESGGAWFLSGGLFQALNTYSASIQANTAAVQANSVLLQQLIDKETIMAADLTGLTAIVTTLASDTSGLATAIAAVETELAAAKAAGWTPASQAALDAAVASLTTTHTQLQADAAAAVP
jgi:hypothetical protein